MFADVRAMAQAAVKIIAGQEFGFLPFESMTDLHVIQGKITLGANAMAKAIKRSGRYDYKVIEHDEKVCSIDFYQGGEKSGNSTFTIEDARKAGVKNLDKFPRNMLFARCISNGLRWFAPDAVNATIYTPEEIETVEFEPPPKRSVIPGVQVIPVPAHEAPSVAPTKPVGVPTQPPAPVLEMGVNEFKVALDIMRAQLPKWRYKEIVQEFVMVEEYQPGDELDAIERDRAPMIAKLQSEAQFFLDKEKRAHDRKTSTTFWNRVGALQAGREFGMALVEKWTNDKVTDWNAAQAELERSVAGAKAA